MQSVHREGFVRRSARSSRKARDLTRRKMRMAADFRQTADCSINDPSIANYIWSKATPRGSAKQGQIGVFRQFSAQGKNTECRKSRLHKFWRTKNSDIFTAIGAGVVKIQL